MTSSASEGHGVALNVSHLDTEEAVPALKYLEDFATEYDGRVVRTGEKKFTDAEIDAAGDEWR